MSQDNRPTHRVIAKATDKRDDRFEPVGVAWRRTTKEDDGTERETISIVFSPFVDGARLVRAEAVLLVPNNERKPGEGRQPGDDDDVPVDAYDRGSRGGGNDRGGSGRRW